MAQKKIIPLKETYYFIKIYNFLQEKQKVNFRFQIEIRHVCFTYPVSK